MALDEDEQPFLTAAEGYVELGMFLDANEEIERLDPFLRSAPEVLELRLRIYEGLQKWELMQTVASKLAKFDPDEIQWAVDWAYATRHADSLEAAKRILEHALERHPEEAHLHFNLACYECQLGNIHSAKELLAEACRLGKVWKQRALEDKDLEPLWESL